MPSSLRTSRKFIAAARISISTSSAPGLRLSACCKASSSITPDAGILRKYSVLRDCGACGASESSFVRAMRPANRSLPRHATSVSPSPMRISRHRCRAEPSAPLDPRSTKRQEMRCDSIIAVRPIPIAGDWATDTASSPLTVCAPLVTIQTGAAACSISMPWISRKML